MEELLKSLIYIQQNLNAPKDKYNKFGNFPYRSLEGIEAAIKPLLAEQNCGIRFNDELEEHCGRVFLKTTLTFFNTKGESISTSTIAEHASEKSGMDVAQISGAASSYARKYAMNALFAIDDTKDADTDEYHNQQSQSTPAPTQQKRSRKNATTPQPQQQQAPVAQPSAPIDPRYAGIKSAIDAASDMSALLSLYSQHKNEVENNETIKALFTQRKLQLQSAKVA